MNDNAYEFVCSIDNGFNFKSKLLALYSYAIKSRLPKNFGGLKNKIDILEKDFYRVPLL